MALPLLAVLVMEPPAPPPPPTDCRKTPVDCVPVVEIFPERRAVTFPASPPAPTLPALVASAPKEKEELTSVAEGEALAVIEPP